MSIKISETRDIEREKIIALYKANGWSAAEKPDECSGIIHASKIHGP